MNNSWVYSKKGKWERAALFQYNAKSPKQGRRRFNSIVKTIHIANLGIVYLWLNSLYCTIIIPNYNNKCLVHYKLLKVKTNVNFITNEK